MKQNVPNVKRRSGGKAGGKVQKPKPKSATELDAELASYMVKTKGGLDSQLDDYMSQTKKGLDQALDSYMAEKGQSKWAAPLHHLSAKRF